MLSRYENNKLILSILIKEYPEFKNYYALMEDAIRVFEDQRFGQIWCNYICPDYRSLEPSEDTIKMMETLFPNNRDPFFEESNVTLERLKN